MGGEHFPTLDWFLEKQVRCELLSRIFWDCDQTTRTVAEDPFVYYDHVYLKDGGCGKCKARMLLAFRVFSE